MIHVSGQLRLNASWVHSCSDTPFARYRLSNLLILETISTDLPCAYFLQLTDSLFEGFSASVCCVNNSVLSGVVQHDN